jgi:hypothetical protein
MFAGFFNCREVDEFADRAVADLAKRVPPSAIDNPAKKTAERLYRTNDMIFTRAETFARSVRLNFYQRAHLGNRVKWALREAGYPVEFIDALTFELVKVITLAGRVRRKAAS